MKLPCVYLLARSSHGTFYTGVTSNLVQRIHQHREGAADGFTKRYGIKRLVWFERHETMESAIHREKQVKRWARAYRYDLVGALNPTWRDLAEDLGFAPLPVLEEKADPGVKPGVTGGGKLMSAFHPKLTLADGALRDGSPAAIHWMAALAATLWRPFRRGPPAPLQ